MHFAVFKAKGFPEKVSKGVFPNTRIISDVSYYKLACTDAKKRFSRQIQLRI